MDTPHRTPNALIASSSPYLLQHAYNPVQWLPWGEQAWARARAENKLVLISIGYSACHWCHVMERECFEHQAVAEVMNRHYICIKVDREERPDVDQIYMDAVQLMRGSGGWPLNCFALPDGRPIFGGTYFPRPQWVQVLQDLAAFYEREPAKAEAYAANLTEAIGQLERVVAPAEAPAHTRDELVRHYIQFEQRIDHLLGGTLGAPKFPVPCNWQWLLRHAELSGAEAALSAVTRTLDAMADGGIYDHIGGGFARYSVDARWHIPHFEKMLYDNGQLVSLYAEAYRATQQPRYAAVVQQTLAFVARELTHAEGGFYSALDADSEGVEGKFYVFTQAEIEAVCGAAAPLITLTYNTTAEGNWEHGLNHLYRSRSDAELAELLGIDEPRLVRERAEAEAALLAYRATRVRPGLDDKVLTGWNALMTRGYVEAYRALGTRAYLDAALRNQHFIERVMAEGPRLNRVWKAGANGDRSSINAYLDDYAFNLEALVALYQATLDPACLRLAEARAQYVLEHFTDAETGLCYYTSDLDPPLIARKHELYDSVTPSGNAALAHALLSLGTLLDRADWRARSGQMLAALSPLLRQQAGNLSCWAMLQQRHVIADRQVAIVGPEAEAWHGALARRFWPEVLALGSAAPTDYPPLLGGKGAPGQTLAYICIGQTCRRPVSSLAELEAELSALRQAP